MRQAGAFVGDCPLAGLGRIDAGLLPGFPVRCCFSALPGGLRALVAWLLRRRVTAAVLEATGIYWETPCEVLEGAGVLPLLVHAQHIEQITGCRTDVLQRGARNFLLRGLPNRVAEGGRGSSQAWPPDRWSYTGGGGSWIRGGA